MVLSVPVEHMADRLGIGCVLIDRVELNPESKCFEFHIAQLDAPKN
jgi:hypothetical protein